MNLQEWFNSKLQELQNGQDEQNGQTADHAPSPTVVVVEREHQRPVDGAPHVFHSAEIGPSDGRELDLDGATVVVVEITGSATSATVVFEGSFNGTYRPVLAVRARDGQAASQTSTLGEVWLVPTINFEKLRCRLSAVSGGSVTVVGRRTMVPLPLLLSATLLVNGVAAPGDATNGLDVDVTRLPYVDKTVLVDNVATDTTGVKLSYTVPTGKTARVAGVSWWNNSGTPTVALELVRGANTVVIRSDSASYREVLGLRLEAGDTLRFNVTTAAAASSTADATISLEELR